ncbi:MAG: disulfide oxidoreductase [Thermoactinomyces sp.]|jgi:disulfide bond formation protein DsbB
MKRLLNTYGLYFAWIVAIVATGGSLFFSEVLGFIPCTLCWVQRIFMYPLVILLGIASYRSDRHIIPYVLPLTIIGGCVSLYHYLEQKVPALAKVASCQVGVPCTQEWINWFGFITIPFLALIAFILITLFLSFARKEVE